jgi:hypothetical protein
MKADGGNLYRAQAALSFLGHIATFYNDNEANNPPTDFWFGLATILGYIEDEVIAADTARTEEDEKCEKNGA